jgi:hypothetical protein
MIDFVDDDLSYLVWVAAHPHGYALNVRSRQHPARGRFGGRLFR